MRFALVLAAAVLVGLGLGQGMGMMPGMDILHKPLMLLQRAEVEKELKLDGKQKAEIKKVVKEYNDEMQKLSKEAQTNPSAGMALMNKFGPMTDEYGKRATTHLNEQQVTRLKQIEYQCEGNICLARPDVQSALALDAAQKQLVDDIAKDVQKNRTKIMMDNVRDPRKMKAELDKYRAQVDETLLKVLNPEQQDKLKALFGPEFKDLNKVRG